MENKKINRNKESTNNNVEQIDISNTKVYSLPVIN